MSDDGQSQVEEKKPETHESEEKKEEPTDSQEKGVKKKVKVSGWSAASPEPPKDKEDQRREYFQTELKRLQKNLKNEKTKIKTPPCKEYTPYIHNPLTPYFTTDTAEKVFNEASVKKCFSSRPTAIGLCDPWIDHKMDVETLEYVESQPPVKFKEIGLRKAGGKQYEGSTRLPKYPAVSIEKPELANSKDLNYGDVPQLRKELKEKTSSKSSSKLKADYKRTKNDFYRMDLDKLNEVHPLNRGHMKDAYYAYLQNTPGSKKAIRECVQEVEGDGEQEHEDEEEMEDKKGSEADQEKEDGGDSKEKAEDGGNDGETEDQEKDEEQKEEE